MHENGLGPAELVTTRHEQCGFTNLHTEKTRSTFIKDFKSRVSVARAQKAEKD